MSELSKTSIYVVCALILAGVAFVARPRPERVTLPDRVNKPVFDGLDPGKVQGLKIIRYDEELGEVHRFEVARNLKNGLWTIPSHSDYPADAADRIRDAATIFVGLNVLGIVTEDAREHPMFGVVEPSEDKLKIGDKGVGLLVSFESEKGKDFSLVVGKKVKGADDHRFVRIPAQDVVYDVKIDPEKLSTKFEDWIEKDLLKLSTWDVENVRIKDYSLVPAVDQQGRQRTYLDPRLEMAVSWNSTDSKWVLDEFLTYREKEKVPTQLLDTEELNKEKLDAMKTALGDLKIVDVRRKPKGLGANLRAGTDFLNDQETLDSLVDRGFYPSSLGSDQVDLLAANGEVYVGMKDAVEYILRFGNIAESIAGAKEGQLNRYLLVTARVNDKKLPIPDPPAGLDAAKAAEVKEAAEKAATAAPAEKPAAKAEAPTAPAAGAPAAEKPAEPQPAASPPAEPKPTESGAVQPAGENQFVPVALLEDASEPAAPAPEAPAVPEPQPPANPAPAETPGTTPAAAPTAPAPAAGEPSAGEKPAAPAAPPTAEPPKPEAAKEAPKTEAVAAPPKPEMPPAGQESEREKLAKDYQRKLDEWHEKKKKADNKVRELNARFADWYYVISEDVYKKIHLGRGDLVKPTEKAKAEGFGVDAFRDLEQKGVEEKKADTSGASSTETPAPLVNP